MFPRPLRLALIVLLVAVSPGLRTAAQTATPIPDSPPVQAAAPNLPPIVNASIFPRRVVYLDAGPSAGADMWVDATQSEDPEGQPLEFSSDVNGDGVFTPWFFRPEAAETITMPGPFVATVRARDPFGAVGREQFQMVARRFARSLVGEASSPAIGFGVANGRPAFVYDTRDGIVITGSEAADGRGRWTTTTVKPANVIAEWFGLSEYTWVANCQLADAWAVGLLCTFNLEDGSYELRYLAAGYAFAGQWSDDREVVRVRGDPAATLGRIQNAPAVLYFNNGALMLLVASGGAQDAVMVSEGFEMLWSHDVGAAPPHTHSAVVEVGGRAALPAYVYLDASRAQLMYTVNQQSNGRGKWDVYPIEGQANDTGTPSLAMIAGRPAVAYRDGFNGHLKIAVNEKADGRGKWQVTEVYPPAKNSPPTQSLADIGGRAGIAFEDSERGLLFAYDPGTAIPNYWAVALVDGRSYPNIRRNPILADIEGQPVIGYGPYALNYGYAR